jgi:diguanylate cyclase
MSDPAKEQLIETLRKAVSRTSMMAEGLDPQLDLTLKNIRQQIASGADEASVSKILKNAEPMLLAADEARELRAKKLRDTLNDLIDILERLPNYDVPQKQKKDLQTQIRSHWQSIYRWPELTADFLLLAEATLNSAHNTTQKTSLFGRLFQKNTNKDHKPNDTAIVGECAQTLTSLLDNLSLPESFDEQVNDVKRFLSDSKELTFLPKMVAESVNLAMIALGKTQQDLTTYLSQLNTQLASINASIVTSYKNQRSLRITIKNRLILAVKVGISACVASLPRRG